MTVLRIRDPLALRYLAHGAALLGLDQILRWSLDNSSLALWLILIIPFLLIGCATPFAKAARSGLGAPF